MIGSTKRAKLLLAAAWAACAIGWGGRVDAQTAPQRTLEELKAEAQARADRNAYPLAGLKPDEVREALARLHSLDRDEWAASWSVVGDRYMAKANAELSATPSQADADFRQAWLYYSFARWPVPNSPGKQRAYEKALEAYTAHGRRCRSPTSSSCCRAAIRRKTPGSTRAAATWGAMPKSGPIR